MPLFGAHLSIARGLANVVTAATDLGCDAVQIFTKNASHWAAAPLVADEVAAFRAAVAGSAVRRTAVHDSYLINLASPSDELFAKSVAAFVDELERAESIGADYLVTHPGAHTGSGEEAGLARVAAGLDDAHARCPGFTVRVLLETTAGQGTTLGYRFEQLAAILDRAACADRLGVCFDTCHAFAAGYGLASADDYATTFEQFDDLIGLERLNLFHVNDSAKSRGSRVDRHAGIGLGEIGEEAFRRLLTDPRFAEHSMILETPGKDDSGNDMLPVNLAALRRLAAEGPVG